MKKSFVCLLIAVVMLLCSCEKQTLAPMPTVLDESYLNGWYVENDTVYMVCRFFVKSEASACITITAYSQEDVGNLLSSPKLMGYNEDMSGNFFTLTEGINEFTVIFVGKYGQGEEKADFKLPDNIVLEHFEQLP